MPGPGIGWDGWGNKERDANSRSVITRPPTVVLQNLRSELVLSQALPLHFRLKTDLQAGQGAAPDPLPVPASESKPKSEGEDEN